MRSKSMAIVLVIRPFQRVANWMVFQLVAGTTEAAWRPRSEGSIRGVALRVPGKERAPGCADFSPDRCVRGALITVLFCTSQRQRRAPHPSEVQLNGTDGMDCETFCDCSILYTIPSAKLFGRRGRFSLERRRQIRTKVRDLLRLNATD
jgi:hypothetical protein